MKINYRFWNKNKKDVEQRSFFNTALSYSNSGFAADNAMKLSAVYQAVEIITNSIAQLPLEVYRIDKLGYKEKYINHPAYYVLNREPNKKMSRFTFIKTLVTTVLLRGNGYAHIARDSKGNCTSLQLIAPENVTVIQKGDETYYNITGIKEIIESCNMIHILNFSYDGINGVSTLTHASNSLRLSSDAEASAEGFFAGGCNLAGILKVSSSLSDKQKEGIKNSWNQAFSPSTGTPNGIAVLEGNMDFSPVTVSPADAQMLESRQYNIIEIARWFGVSPTLLFDYSKSSYNTLEQTNLQFLTNTLSPLLQKIELEFERKIFKPSERESIDLRFDTEILLRTDKKSLAEYYNKLFQIGAITINEVRKTLDLPPIENGDNTFVQVNVNTLKNATREIKEPINNNVKQDEGNKE